MFVFPNYLRPLLCAGLLFVVSACNTTKNAKNNISDSAAAASQHVSDIDTYNQCTGDGEIAVTHFDFDSDEILPSAREIIDKHVVDCIKKSLMDNHDKKVLITGYCDKRGTAEYNIGLGARRAGATESAILNELNSLVKSECSECPIVENAAEKDYGTIYKKSICTASKGKEDLVDNGDTEQAHAKNRRTVIEFVDECN